MDFSEFVAVVAAPGTPELKDFERISAFAHDADRDLLWTALGHAGIHPIYRALLVQALHRRIVEDLERERARQRRREEDARLEAAKDEPPRPTRRRTR